MKTDNKTVDILGRKYKIIFTDSHHDKRIDGYFGLTCSYEDEPFILIATSTEDDEETTDFTMRTTLRHELIHAFIHESGLDHCTNHYGSWAVDEQVVEWFALQSPKIFALFKELECL